MADDRRRLMAFGQVVSGGPEALVELDVGGDEHRARVDALEMPAPLEEQVEQVSTPSPKGRRLFPNLTVAENLSLGRLRRRCGDGIRWELDRIFEFFPRTRERLDSKAETLSGGEQQMVAIARALPLDRGRISHDGPAGPRRTYRELRRQVLWV